MKPNLLARLLGLVLLSGLCAVPASALPATTATAATARTLVPYRDEAELAAALDKWRQAAQAQQQARARAFAQQAAPMAPAATMAAPAPMADMAGNAVTAGKAAAAEEGITNNQVAGVDEGGIVKRAGDHLVILRRGRLFTVRVGADQLQPGAMIEAYAPGSDPRGAWYDELLISGRTVVVVGYSYARGGTEIGLFDLGSDGALSYRATYHLRSHDYYSARNYASRLVGQRLVFYSPTVLQPWGQPWAQMMPAMRRHRGQSVPVDFERILPATRIHRTDDEFDPGQPLALHTVTSCDLGEPVLRCEASAVLGPVGRVFHVSQGSVYVWTQAQRQRAIDGSRQDMPTAASAVFRLPLDGSAPSGLKTVGMPTDQMSFLEDADGFLNVLLREQGRGEGIWGAGGWVDGASSADASRGRIALFRVPLTALGDGRSAAQREHYRRLPGPASGALQNRFVGDWLLWGTGQQAWAVRFAQSTPAARLEPGHAVERIEPMGTHALLVGNAGSELNFSAVRLSRGEARVDGVHRQAGARQGETRSHGFFYRATSADEGLLGLPVLAADTREPGGSGAAVTVLRQRDLVFTGLGELSSQTARPADDRCKASCVDWYGNARPIFMGQRVLALMGYELVEGELQGRGAQERIVEKRRLDFAPRFKQLLPMRASPFE